MTEELKQLLIEAEQATRAAYFAQNPQSSGAEAAYESWSKAWRAAHMAAPDEYKD